MPEGTRAPYIYLVQMDIPAEHEADIQPHLRHRACAGDPEGPRRPRLHALRRWRRPTRTACRAISRVYEMDCRRRDEEPGLAGGLGERRLGAEDPPAHHQPVAHRDAQDQPEPRARRMKSDLEIARATKLRPIAEIAAKLDIPADALEPYGRHKAKVGFDFIKPLEDRPDGALVLVTGISPTPAGEGKTTTTVGLGDALNRIGSRAVICLREPSLGPSFGMKGGAAGGGYAQVVPMDQINLHFTGDFHAITSANNLLAAMIDNHIYWGNALGIDARRVSWRRCLDMNDRALRSIVGSLGGVANGFPREDGFDITVASEVMAVFCLSRNLDDLQERLGRMIVAQKRDGDGGDGEGPEGGRRHGGAAEGRAGAQPGADAGGLARVRAWRAVRQHRAWLQLGDGDAARAEAGRRGGDRGRLRRRPGRGEVHRHQVPLGRAEAVLRRGGGDRARAEDAWRRGAQCAGRGECRRGAARRGQPGAPRGEPGEVRPAGGGRREPLHLGHGGRVRGDPRRDGEAGRRGDLLHPLGRRRRRRRGAGPRGAAEDHAGRGEARAAVSRRRCRSPRRSAPSRGRSTGRRTLRCPMRWRGGWKGFEKAGFGHVPVCIAKTQYSFTADPTVMGAPEGLILPVREVRLSAGAGFVVAICGDIMTMPGLPRVPVGRGDPSAGGRRDRGAVLTARQSFMLVSLALLTKKGGDEGKRGLWP